MFINKLCILSRSTADEEPLVNGGVDLRRGKLLVRRQRRQGLSRNAAGRVLDSRVGARAESKKLVKPTIYCHMGRGDFKTYVETLPGWVLPVMRRSQASAHSRMTSMA